MSKTYQRMTLDDLIDALDKLGDTPVRGLSGEVYSYRGYYERNATAPCGLTHTGRLLADLYRKQIGKDMQGWKGGDYRVDGGELIYYTSQRDTGPCIIGLEQAGVDGYYEPVLLDEDRHF